MFFTQVVSRILPGSLELTNRAAGIEGFFHGKSHRSGWRFQWENAHVENYSEVIPDQILSGMSRKSPFRIGTSSTTW